LGVLWSAKTLFLLAGTGSYQQNLTILHSKEEGQGQALPLQGRKGWQYRVT
jgi:hypothetical protein